MGTLGAPHLLYAPIVIIFGSTLFSICSAFQTCSSPWKFVYQHDSTGIRLEGEWQDLADAQQRGARIRYVIPALGERGYAEELDTTVIFRTVLCGESTLHLDKDRWDHFQDGGQWRFVVVCTDGRYEQYQYDVGAHTMFDETYSDVGISWFVQESTCPTQIYAHSGDGSGLTGSREALENAVLNAYDIKIRVADGLTFPMHNIDVTDFTDVISGQNIWSFYTPDNLGVEWWFQITSTTGLIDTIFWNVGEHVSADHSHYQEGLDWLVEPCWRHVYSNDPTGAETRGSRADLVAAVERGQRVKVVIGKFSIELDNVRSDWGKVSGQLLSHISKTDKTTFADESSWVWQMVHTTGTVTTKRYNIGDVTNTGNWRENKQIGWYVDTRRWTKVLSTDSTGLVTFGSKLSLREAIQAGASVRVGIQFDQGGRVRLGGILGRGRVRGSSNSGPSGWDGDSRGWFVMKAENLEIGSYGEVAAELIKSVSTKSVGNDEFEIRDNPFWRFMLVTTESNVDFFQWRVGTHISDGHFVRKANVNWFVNK